MSEPMEPVASASPVPAGEIGKPRPIGITILLFIVTCGIYGLFWSYFVFEENKRYSNQGVGGVVGLILWIFVGIVNVFLLPHEIAKNLYNADGRESPISVWQGLWILLPLVGMFIWLFNVQKALNEFWVSKGAEPV